MVAINDIVMINWQNDNMPRARDWLVDLLTMSIGVTAEKMQLQNDGYAAKIVVVGQWLMTMMMKELKC